MSNIAIVGMACRFPGRADTLEGYWQLLENGDCAITEIPADRWSLHGFYDPRPGIPTRSCSKWGGFIDQVRSFDSGFFGLSPREADAMDPQQRLLLEVAFEAVQDAGLTLEDLRQSQTGVFVGASNIDYGLLQRFRFDRGDVLAGTGTALSIVANRISNTLCLTGPSLVTDTACSSSLVALDTACRHLADGSCNAALVGGANALLDPRMFVTFSRAHMLSPTGRIRAFDAAADGFVRGEGIGLVLLRRLADAEADNNRIYATIEATAINQDGGTGAITAPNPAAQVAMMRTVLARAGIAARDVTFAEAHGTGTSLGDPIEAGAIGTVFGGAERKSPLLIGSSKTNLGHLEPAAGIAGLIKAALALSHGRLPPSVGYDVANPEIDFSGLNIEVAAGDSRSLHNRSGSVALVNSFGFGGTNACALLRAPGKPAQRTSGVASSPVTVTTGLFPPGEARALPLSAPTEEHLKAYAGVLAQQIGNGELKDRSLAEIGHALACCRDHFDFRAVIISNSVAGLHQRLIALSEGKAWPRVQKSDPPGIVTGQAGKHGKLAFTMTGQGGQWWAMGRELLLHNQPFRNFFETFDASFKPLSGWSVIGAMMADESDSRLDDAAITPPVMFAFQCGLAEIWRSVGVTPDLVVGHSFGEVTAAYLAGAISLDHVARLVMYRGLIRGSVDRAGTMAAIGLGADDIKSLLPADGSIEIGGYNSPNLVTLTGEEQAINTLIAALNRDDPDIVTRKLALDFAYHSSWFEPVENIFKENVGQLEWSQPDIPVISTVTGVENTRFDANYWWSNLRNPVRYQDGINRALALGTDTFIELGPTRTLSSMTAGCAAAENVSVTTVSTLQRRWSDFESIATAIGELYCAGHELDWQAIAGHQPTRLDLPRQPWLRETCWQIPAEAGRMLLTEQAHYLLGASDDGPVQSWTQTITLDTHAFLSDHRINDQIVYPAACYIETIYEAATQHLSTDKIDIRDFECTSALYIVPGDEIELRTIVNAALNRIEIHSRDAAQMAQWQLRASAHVLPYETSRPVSSLTKGKKIIDPDRFYEDAAARGYQYGSNFRHLTSISTNGNSASARLENRESDENSTRHSRLPAPLLDSALQLILATPLSGGTRAASPVQYLPVHIARIVVAGELTNGCEVSIRARRDEGVNDIFADYIVHAPDSSHCTTITDLRACAITSRNQYRDAAATGPGFYREQRVEWAGASCKEDKTGPWLILENQSARLASSLTIAGRDSISGDCAGSSTSRTVREATGQWTAALSRNLTANAGISGIVYRPALLPLDGTPAPDIARTLLQQTIELTALGRALQVVAGQVEMPDIWILIQSDCFGEHATAPQYGQLQHASIPGLVRTLQMECPELRFHTIALDQPDKPDPGQLMEIILSGTRETEFIIANDTIQVVRLSPADDDLVRHTIPVRSLPVHTGYALKARGGGGINSLHWQAEKTPPVRDEEVQVEITHAGLNFRDIMAVSGVLPAGAEPTPAIETLGLEFTGCVVVRGPNAKGFSVNDRVFGMARGALARRISISPERLYPSPDRLTDAEAATLCSAYLTADYALNVVGRLKADEKVLIHNGSGAVGLAAISLARATGARILVTAGKDGKRDYLRDIGLTDVFDSRSLSFSDEILERTNGTGVDVVLNALSGPFIDKALACLAPYGRFLEIGKRDVYADRAVGLKSLRANQSFHVIDVAALLNDRPKIVREIMENLLPRFETGELAPLPHDVFPAGRVEDAFRHFAAADHIGKVVIGSPDEAIPVQTAFSSGVGLDPGGTYLVTGGTRGMGLQASRWLRANGAGHVIAASRTGLPVAARLANGSDPDQGREPHEICVLDITDGPAVMQKIEHIQNSGQPLKGVIHAAVVYEDALLSEMTGEAIARVHAPKIQGGINLTRAVLETGAEPDFFLSFSSAAQVTGWPGQSNYTAANSALQALTHFQRQHGVPGQCIHWGVFGETGHVAESEAMSSYLENAGWGTLDNKTVCDLLARVLDLDEPVLTIAAADWPALGRQHAPIGRAPRFSELCLKETCIGAAHRAPLSGLNGDASGRAAQIVREQVGKVLRVDADTLITYETISEAGIDSLSAFELRNRLEQETNLEISLARFVGAPRIDELAELLCALAREQSGRSAETS